MNQRERDAREVVETLLAAGFQAYFVGGCVRDPLLGRPVSDYDIATNARPEEVQSLFPRTVATGIRHGTVTVLHGQTGVEVTTFRVESEYKDARRPERVRFIDSLYLDLARRDFTINAIARDVNGRYYDPFHGMEDLKAKTIRAVGDPYQRFQEDALRLLRAIRFAAQFDLRIEKETFAALCRNAPQLQRVAVERIRVEWDKVMLGNVAYGMQLLLETGLYPFVFFERKAPPAERLAALSWIQKVQPSLPLRYAALCFWLKFSPGQAEIWLGRLRHAKKFVRSVLMILQALPDPERPMQEMIDWGDVKWREHLLRAGKEAAEQAARILSVCSPLKQALTLHLLYQERITRQPLWSPGDLAIEGHVLLREFPELKSRPRQVGMILQALVKKVLRHPGKNDPNTLLREAKDLLKRIEVFRHERDHLETLEGTSE
jgi:tRNA nucleotidyltransferase (CCA-adding enzyme)